MKTNAYTSTGALIRLSLRRDWLLLLIFVMLPALLAVIEAAASNSLYPTAALRQVFFETASSPAAIALRGPAYASTLGGLTAWTWGWIAALLVGIGSIFFVIRHTRTEEEAGRFELLDSSVVGRQAALSASLIVTLGANVVMAALVAGGLIGPGFPSSGR